MTDEKKSYNIAGEDDMEYVEMYKLDPAIAYTPEINNAILDAVYDVNMRHYTNMGMEEAEAKKLADQHRSQGEATVKHHIEKRGW